MHPAPAPAGWTHGAYWTDPCPLVFAPPQVPHKEEQIPMPFEHEGYTLFSRSVELKGGRQQTIYFFTKKGNTPKSGNPSEKPAEYNVKINARTGLPYLTKK